ncbi:DUF1760-domain-containing protein [Sporormia fimetaria CBS 119925]|uniref:DUF1760-domain-containing protein n=1 Tax=Sporormia fimetaria CBS 119925 TaxID=1340428 RepID=A0A6A6V8I5_9PLEO|nr:DUF1760-domain-containing protein [Sporormia fimetaria CBS 119925]
MAEAKKQDNPLVDALPPVTDYVTYLTIVEYNLTEENLPVLHDVLQDSELTKNIGWDLIQLLLSLLPASEDCLNDIAAKGNPRECILKVTEALRLLEFEDDQTASDSDEDQLSRTEKPLETTGTPPGEPSSSEGQVPLPSSEAPLPYQKFQVLLSLLATLHRRIKTKYPSRFLSTSLQAVLSAFNKASTHQGELTLAVIKFVNALSGTKRPSLPPRTSTGDLLRRTTGSSEPDPEAQQDPPPAEEDTLVNRLLQSFITHICEDYMLSLNSADDVPGLSWSNRLMEKYEPRRIVPNKRVYADLFAEEEGLKSRTAILGQLVALAQDLRLSTEELRRTISDPEGETQGALGDEDDPPESAADIPLSKTGALLLFVARIIKHELYDSASTNKDAAPAIFPDHATLLSNFVGEVGPQTAGMEPEALLDAILALGLVALHNNNIGEPKDDDEFTQYLQTLSLISANSPSPGLRYNAHYIVSTVLRSHPSDLLRLTFIRDTLEHCPYENLKASAVGWLKGETLEANMPQAGEEAEERTESIFATPVALSNVSPFLFPDLTDAWNSKSDIVEDWVRFRTELGFYLAALNFYYLLLTATMLHENLDIVGLHKSSSIEATYLDPLKSGVKRFREALKEGGSLENSETGEGTGHAEMDLALLEDVIKRVESGIRGLNAS